MGATEMAGPCGGSRVALQSLSVIEAIHVISFGKSNLYADLFSQPLPAC